MSQTHDRCPADLDRRARACAVDHLPILALSLATGVAAWRRETSVEVALIVVVATSTVLCAALGAWAGAFGRTPGRARHGLVLLDAVTGHPVGVVRGAARGAVYAAFGWVTAGFGWLLLALVAAGDPWRRSWHDRLVGSVSLVADPVGDSAQDTRSEDPVAELVNLTVARLATGLTVPVPPAEPRRMPVVPLPRRWQVVFDGGESYGVENRLLIGRAAVLDQRQPGWARLASPAGTVSATHAELATRPDGALVLVDRGSTNGSWLVRGEVDRRVPPRRPATLLPGDRVRFGDRWMRVGADTTTQ